MDITTEMGSYEVLETMAVADCALAIEGASLDDLFETAARALAELMVDPATIEARVPRTVTIEAPSLDLLLYDWLAELIFLKDSEQLVMTETTVVVERGTPCRLRAQCVGGVIERPRAALRADPKAVTFHMFTLEPRGDRWHARIVIDI
jgi:SHS2 domain-containing protein